jgi:hypothetical protein
MPIPALVTCHKNWGETGGHNDLGKLIADLREPRRLLKSRVSGIHELSQFGK